MKDPLYSIFSKHFKKNYEMIRGPKIKLYSNEHIDKVFLWLNLL